MPSSLDCFLVARIKAWKNIPESGAALPVCSSINVTVVQSVTESKFLLC